LVKRISQPRCILIAVQLAAEIGDQIVVIPLLKRERLAEDSRGL
jgi:hypothetical protein